MMMSGACWCLVCSLPPSRLAARVLRYIADVLCEFRNSKATKEGYQSRLLFKKRMFRETDESITEPQFINLTYVQVRGWVGGWVAN